MANKKNTDLQEMSELIQIRNYIGFLTQSNLPWLERNDMTEIYNKMQDIDKQLVAIIKEIKF